MVANVAVNSVLDDILVCTASSLRLMNRLRSREPYHADNAVPVLTARREVRRLGSGAAPPGANVAAGTGAAAGTSFAVCYLDLERGGGLESLASQVERASLQRAAWVCEVRNVSGDARSNDVVPGATGSGVRTGCRTVRRATSLREREARGHHSQ